MADRKRKLTCLNFDQKLDILNDLKSNVKSRKEIAKEYGCDLSTISRIMQQEQKIKEMAAKNGNTARKRIRKGKHDEIDQAISIWFKQMRAKDAIISGPMIVEQAKQFSKLLEIEDFEPNNGWLGRWKIKENVSFQRIHGEKAAADHDGASHWITNILPNLMVGYGERDIYNADESGLFYKALPNGTLAAKGETLVGGKNLKDRITLLFICNLEGSDKHVFCVGRSRNPHCFRGKTVPIPYYANAKSWMTSGLWSKILREWDEKLARQKRSILLFADNATCHRLDDVKLKCINIQFLPPNTTSIIQPLDQGIIRAFKVYYRQQIVRKQLLFLEKDRCSSTFAKSVDILEALQMTKRAWELVTATTIRNCFRKAGFSPAVDNSPINESPQNESKVIVDIPEKEFYDFVKIDDDLDCYGELTNEEILQELKSFENNDASEETIEPPPANQTVNRNEALSALMTLKDYFQSKNYDMKNIDALTDQFFDSSSTHVQKKLTDYFK